MRLSEELKSRMEKIVAKYGHPTPIEGKEWYDVSTDGTMISYITSAKERYFEDGSYFDRERRKKFATMAKAGRIMKNWYPCLPDHKIQRLAQLVIPPQFELRTDVADCYMEENTDHHEKTTLGQSCMRSEECHKYLKFYESIGVKILCLMNSENLIIARALVWENISFHEEEGKTFNTTFMDRIYTTKDGQDAVFIQYAREKGWMYKVVQDFKETSVFMRKNKKIYGNFSFTTGKEFIFTNRQTEIDGFHKLPYMDTMYYMDAEAVMWSSGASSNNKIFKFQGEGGECKINVINYFDVWGHIFSCGLWSDVYKCWINEREAVLSKYHSSYVYKDRCTIIIKGGAKDYMDVEYANPEDIVSHKGKQYYKGDVVLCTIKNDKRTIDDCPLFAGVRHLNNRLDESFNIKWSEILERAQDFSLGTKIKIYASEIPVLEQHFFQHFNGYSFPDDVNVIHVQLRYDEHPELLARFQELGYAYLVLNQENKLVQIALPKRKTQ